jgi:Ca-activated chloride channel family protein
MTELPHDIPDRDDLRDRLVDAGLRELFSGESSPDLSAAILAKASVEDSVTPVAAGETAMTSSQRSSGRRGSPWLPLAIAATIAVVAAGLLLPAVQPAREAARRAAPVSGPPPSTIERAPIEQPVSGRSLSSELGKEVSAMERQVHVEAEPVAQAQPPAIQATAPISGRLRRIYEPAAQGETSALPAATMADDDSLAVAPSTITPQEDFDSLVQIIESGVSGESLDAKPGDVLADNLTLQISQSHRVHDGAQAIEERYATPAAPAAARAPGGRPENYGWYQSADMKGGVVYGRGGGQLAGNGAIPYWSRRDAQQLYFEREKGIGPELGGDKYTQIVENAFKAVSAANTDNRLSTFSIDVDTASYANVRQFLMQSHTLPPPDAVRIEELVNYFDYDYTAPTGDVPFAANVEIASCPWKPEHRLARIGIKGREMDRSKRPQTNLVFLIDVSGSMDEPNKLPLLVEGMKLLTRELGENDRVAIAVYASSEGLALESTRGTDQSKILAALDQLAAGGSTAGRAGIQLAYKLAEENFIKGGVNRVILCTDGDFNVGVTSPAELERMAEAKAKDTGVFLTVLGFGRGNLNDAMMEQIADKGNGNYHYVDTLNEARKVLVEEMSGTLVTIAKDVKIQVEFNPAQVAGYRLIGYENRVLAAEDFNDDKKDAGEIGAGHTVTALYEIVPAGKEVDAGEVDDLKYAAPASADGAEEDEEEENEESRGEMLTLKIRYKEPDGDKSSKLEFPITDSDQRFAKASDDFKFASAVAGFGMLLRDSQYDGNATYAAIAEIAEAAGENRDPHGYRKEFVQLVQRAKELSGE